MRGKRKDGVAAVDRAFQILDACTDSDDVLTLADLSERTGLYKSTLLRLCASLTRHQLLIRRQDGAFGIGPGALRMARRYQSTLQPQEAIIPVLKSLVEQSGESASFYVRMGDVRVCMYRVDSPRAIRDHIKVGDVLQLTRGAGGKVLLAFSEGKGPEMAEIRRRMVATSFGERDSETAAVASPVFGVNQDLAGTVSLSGPLTRFDRKTVERMKKLLIAEAAAMTSSLGGDPGVFSRK